MAKNTKDITKTIPAPLATTFGNLTDFASSCYYRGFEDGFLDGKREGFEEGKREGQTHALRRRRELAASRLSLASRTRSTTSRARLGCTASRCTNPASSRSGQPASLTARNSTGAMSGSASFWIRRVIQPRRPWRGYLATPAQPSGRICGT